MTTPQPFPRPRFAEARRRRRIPGSRSERLPRRPPTSSSALPCSLSALLAHSLSFRDTGPLLKLAGGYR